MLGGRSPEEFRDVQRSLVCHSSSVGEAQKQGQDNGLRACTWWDSDRVVLLVASVGGDVVSAKGTCGDVVSAKRTCGCVRDVASTERTCGCARGGMAARQGPLCVYGDMVARCRCGLKESTRRRRRMILMWIFVAAVSLLNIGSGIRPVRFFED